MKTIAFGDGIARSAKRLVTLERFGRALGAVESCRVLSAFRSGRSPFRFFSGGLPIDLHWRPGTSDRYVFEEVFVDETYKGSPHNPVYVVDAGANIGCATLWLATRNPLARVVAIEPAAANFSLLEKNVSCFPRVRPLRAALWAVDGVVDLDDRGDDPSGFRVGDVPARGGRRPVRAVCPATVMAEAGFPRIDFLKIDIEGAERELFSAPTDWLGRTRAVAVETHDRMVSGSRDAVCRALAAHGFQVTELPPMVYARRR